MVAILISTGGSFEINMTMKNYVAYHLKDDTIDDAANAIDYFH